MLSENLTESAILCDAFVAQEVYNYLGYYSIAYLRNGGGAFSLCLHGVFRNHTCLASQFHNRARASLQFLTWTTWHQTIHAQLLTVQKMHRIGSKLNWTFLLWFVREIIFLVIKLWYCKLMRSFRERNDEFTKIKINNPHEDYVYSQTNRLVPLSSCTIDYCWSCIEAVILVEACPFIERIPSSIETVKRVISRVINKAPIWHELMPSLFLSVVRREKREKMTPVVGPRFYKFFWQSTRMVCECQI